MGSSVISAVSYRVSSGPGAQVRPVKFRTSCSASSEDRLRYASTSADSVSSPILAASWNEMKVGRRLLASSMYVA